MIRAWLRFFLFPPILFLFVMCAVGAVVGYVFFAAPLAVEAIFGIVALLILLHDNPIRRFLLYLTERFK